MRATSTLSTSSSTAGGGTNYYSHFPQQQQNQQQTSSSTQSTNNPAFTGGESPRKVAAAEDELQQLILSELEALVRAARLSLRTGSDIQAHGGALTLRVIYSACIKYRPGFVLRFFPRTEISALVQAATRPLAPGAPIRSSALLVLPVLAAADPRSFLVYAEASKFSLWHHAISSTTSYTDACIAANVACEILVVLDTKDLIRTNYFQQNNNQSAKSNSNINSRLNSNTNISSSRSNTQQSQSQSQSQRQHATAALATNTTLVLSRDQIGQLLQTLTKTSMREALANKVTTNIAPHLRFSPHWCALSLLARLPEEHFPLQLLQVLIEDTSEMSKSARLASQVADIHLDGLSDILLVVQQLIVPQIQKTITNLSCLQTNTTSFMKTNSQSISPTSAPQQYSQYQQQLLQYQQMQNQLQQQIGKLNRLRIFTERALLRHVGVLFSFTASSINNSSQFGGGRKSRSQQQGESGTMQRGTSQLQQNQQNQQGSSSSRNIHRDSLDDGDDDDTRSQASSYFQRRSNQGGQSGGRHSSSMDDLSDTQSVGNLSRSSKYGKRSSSSNAGDSSMTPRYQGAGSSRLTSGGGGGGRSRSAGANNFISGDSTLTQWTNWAQSNPKLKWAAFDVLSKVDWTDSSVALTMFTSYGSNFLLANCDVVLRRVAMHALTRVLQRSVRQIQRDAIAGKITMIPETHGKITLLGQFSRLCNVLLSSAVSDLAPDIRYNALVLLSFPIFSTPLSSNMSIDTVTIALRDVCLPNRLAGMALLSHVCRFCPGPLVPSMLRRMTSILVEVRTATALPLGVLEEQMASLLHIARSVKQLPGAMFSSLLWLVSQIFANQDVVSTVALVLGLDILAELGNSFADSEKLTVWSRCIPEILPLVSADAPMRLLTAAVRTLSIIFRAVKGPVENAVSVFGDEASGLLVSTLQKILEIPHEDGDVISEELKTSVLQLLSVFELRVTVRQFWGPSSSASTTSSSGGGSSNSITTTTSNNYANNGNPSSSYYSPIPTANPISLLAADSNYNYNSSSTGLATATVLGAADSEIDADQDRQLHQVLTLSLSEGRAYSRGHWADQVLRQLQSLTLSSVCPSTETAIFAVRAIARILTSNASTCIPSRSQHFRSFALNVMQRAKESTTAAHCATLLVILGEVAEESDPESINHLLSDETVEALLQLWSQRDDAKSMMIIMFPLAQMFSQVAKAYVRSGRPAASFAEKAPLVSAEMLEAVTSLATTTTAQAQQAAIALLDCVNHALSLAQRYVTGVMLPRLSQILAMEAPIEVRAKAANVIVHRCEDQPSSLDGFVVSLVSLCSKILMARTQLQQEVLKIQAEEQATRLARLEAEFSGDSSLQGAGSGNVNVIQSSREKKSKLESSSSNKQKNISSSSPSSRQQQKQSSSLNTTNQQLQTSSNTQYLSVKMRASKTLQSAKNRKLLEDFGVIDVSRYFELSLYTLLECPIEFAAGVRWNPLEAECFALLCSIVKRRRYTAMRVSTLLPTVRHVLQQRFATAPGERRCRLLDFFERCASAPDVDYAPPLLLKGNVSLNPASGRMASFGNATVNQNVFDNSWNDDGSFSQQQQQQQSASAASAASSNANQPNLTMSSSGGGTNTGGEDNNRSYPVTNNTTTNNSPSLFSATPKTNLTSISGGGGGGGSFKPMFTLDSSSESGSIGAGAQINTANNVVAHNNNNNDNNEYFMASNGMKVRAPKSLPVPMPCSMRQPIAAMVPTTSSTTANVSGNLSSVSGHISSSNVNTGSIELRTPLVKPRGLMSLMNNSNNSAGSFHYISSGSGNTPQSHHLVFSQRQQQQQEQEGNQFSESDKNSPNQQDIQHVNSGSGSSLMSMPSSLVLPPALQRQQTQQPHSQVTEHNNNANTNTIPPSASSATVADSDKVEGIEPPLLPSSSSNQNQTSMPLSSSSGSANFFRESPKLESTVTPSSSSAAKDNNKNQSQSQQQQQAFVRPRAISDWFEMPLVKPQNWNEWLGRVCDGFVEVSQHSDLIACQTVIRHSNQMQRTMFPLAFAAALTTMNSEQVQDVLEELHDVVFEYLAFYNNDNNNDNINDGDSRNTSSSSSPKMNTNTNTNGSLNLRKQQANVINSAASPSETAFPSSPAIVAFPPKTTRQQHQNFHGGSGAGGGSKNSSIIGSMPHKVASSLSLAAHIAYCCRRQIHGHPTSTIRMTPHLIVHLSKQAQMIPLAIHYAEFLILEQYPKSMLSSTHYRPTFDAFAESSSSSSPPLRPSSFRRADSLKYQSSASAAVGATISSGSQNKEEIISPLDINNFDRPFATSSSFSQQQQVNKNIQATTTSSNSPKKNKTSSSSSPHEKMIVLGDLASSYRMLYLPVPEDILIELRKAVFEVTSKATNVRQVVAAIEALSQADDIRAALLAAANGAQTLLSQPQPLKRGAALKSQNDTTTNNINNSNQLEPQDAARLIAPLAASITHLLNENCEFDFSLHYCVELSDALLSKNSFQTENARRGSSATHSSTSRSISPPFRSPVLDGNTPNNNIHEEEHHHHEQEEAIVEEEPQQQMNLHEAFKCLSSFATSETQRQYLGFEIARSTVCMGRWELAEDVVESVPSAFAYRHWVGACCAAFKNDFPQMRSEISAGRKKILDRSHQLSSDVPRRAFWTGVILQGLSEIEHGVAAITSSDPVAKRELTKSLRSRGFSDSASLPETCQCLSMRTLFSPIPDQYEMLLRFGRNLCLSGDGGRFISLVAPLVKGSLKHLSNSIATLSNEYVSCSLDSVFSSSFVLDGSSSAATAENNKDSAAGVFSSGVHEKILELKDHDGIRTSQLFNMFTQTLLVVEAPAVDEACDALSQLEEGLKETHNEVLQVLLNKVRNPHLRKFDPLYDISSLLANLRVTILSSVAEAQRREFSKFSSTQKNEEARIVTSYTFNKQAVELSRTSAATWTSYAISLYRLSLALQEAQASTGGQVRSSKIEEMRSECRIAAINALLSDPFGVVAPKAGLHHNNNSSGGGSNVNNSENYQSSVNANTNANAAAATSNYSQTSSYAASRNVSAPASPVVNNNNNNNNVQQSQNFPQTTTSASSPNQQHHTVQRETSSFSSSPHNQRSSTSPTGTGGSSRHQQNHHRPQQSPFFISGITNIEETSLLSRTGAIQTREFIRESSMLLILLDLWNDISSSPLQQQQTQQTTTSSGFPTTNEATSPNSSTNQQQQTSDTTSSSSPSSTNPQTPITAQQQQNNIRHTASPMMQREISKVPQLKWFVVLPVLVSGSISGKSEGYLWILSQLLRQHFDLVAPDVVSLLSSKHCSSNALLSAMAAITSTAHSNHHHQQQNSKNDNNNNSVKSESSEGISFSTFGVSENNNETNGNSNVEGEGQEQEKQLQLLQEVLNHSKGLEDVFDELFAHPESALAIHNVEAFFRRARPSRSYGEISIRHTRSVAPFSWLAGHRGYIQTVNQLQLVAASFGATSIALGGSGISFKNNLLAANCMVQSVYTSPHLVKADLAFSSSSSSFGNTQNNNNATNQNKQQRSQSLTSASQDTSYVSIPTDEDSSNATPPRPSSSSHHHQYHQQRRFSSSSIRSSTSLVLPPGASASASASNTTPQNSLPLSSSLVRSQQKQHIRSSSAGNNNYNSTSNIYKPSPSSSVVAESLNPMHSHHHQYHYNNNSFSQQQQQPQSHYRSGSGQQTDFGSYSLASINSNGLTPPLGPTSHPQSSSHQSQQQQLLGSGSNSLLEHSISFNEDNNNNNNTNENVLVGEDSVPSSHNFTLVMFNGDLLPFEVSWDTPVANFEQASRLGSTIDSYMSLLAASASSGVHHFAALETCAAFSVPEDGMSCLSSKRQREQQLQAIKLMTTTIPQYNNNNTNTSNDNNNATENINENVNENENKNDDVLFFDGVRSYSSSSDQNHHRGSELKSTSEGNKEQKDQDQDQDQKEETNSKKKEEKDNNNNNDSNKNKTHSRKSSSTNSSRVNFNDFFDEHHGFFATTHQSFASLSSLCARPKRKNHFRCSALVGAAVAAIDVKQQQQNINNMNMNNQSQQQQPFSSLFASSLSNSLASAARCWEDASPSQRASILQDVWETHPNFTRCIAETMLHSMEDPSSWLRARSQFTEHLACWGATSYIGCLNTRSLSSFSMCPLSGSVAMTGRLAARYPDQLPKQGYFKEEPTPFRLTKCFVRAMDAGSASGVFQHTLTFSLAQLSHDSEMLSIVIDLSLASSSTFVPSASASASSPSSSSYCSTTATSRRNSSLYAAATDTEKETLPNTKTTTTDAKTNNTLEETILNQFIVSGNEVIESLRNVVKHRTLQTPQIQQHRYPNPSLLVPRIVVPRKQQGRDSSSKDNASNNENIPSPPVAYSDIQTTTTTTNNKSRSTSRSPSPNTTTVEDSSITTNATNALNQHSPPSQQQQNVQTSTTPTGTLLPRQPSAALLSMLGNNASGSVLRNRSSANLSGKDQASNAGTTTSDSASHSNLPSASQTPIEITSSNEKSLSQRSATTTTTHSQSPTHGNTKLQQQQQRSRTASMIESNKTGNNSENVSLQGSFGISGLSPISAGGNSELGPNNVTNVTAAALAAVAAASASSSPGVGKLSIVNTTTNATTITTTQNLQLDALNDPISPLGVLSRDISSYNKTSNSSSHTINNNKSDSNLGKIVSPSVGEGLDEVSLDTMNNNNQQQQQQQEAVRSSSPSISPPPSASAPTTMHQHPSKEQLQKQQEEQAAIRIQKYVRIFLRKRAHGFGGRSVSAQSMARSLIRAATLTDRVVRHTFGWAPFA